VKAFEMLRDAVEWRVAHGVDEWIATPCDPDMMRDLRNMIPTNPCFAYSRDDGLPIMIQRVGLGDAKLAAKYPPDKHVRPHCVSLTVCLTVSTTVSRTSFPTEMPPPNRLRRRPFVALSACARRRLLATLPLPQPRRWAHEQTALPLL
jgi:hypothetical protein